MKNIYWVLLLFPLIQACATHAPISEVVMFNTRADSTGNFAKRGGGFSSNTVGISNAQFEKKRKADFDQYSLIEEPISLSMFRSYGDDFAIGTAFFHSFGIDFTKKVRNNSFVTASLSANTSSKIILQNRVYVDDNLGLSLGLFYGHTYRGYNDYSNCFNDEPCGSSYSFGSESRDYLKNAGLRSRFVMRSGQDVGITLTGYLEYGWLFEIDDKYLEFGVSFIGF